jgi:hypothetical protein
VCVRFVTVLQWGHAQVSKAPPGVKLSLREALQDVMVHVRLPLIAKEHPAMLEAVRLMAIDKALLQEVSAFRWPMMQNTLSRPHLSRTDNMKQHLPYWPLLCMVPISRHGLPLPESKGGLLSTVALLTPVAGGGVPG